MEQLEFDFFEKKEKYSFDDFILFNENLEAYSFLINNEDEHLGKDVIFLSGAEKSGKSHLGYLWKIKKNAKVIDYDSILKLSDNKFSAYLLSVIEQYDNYLIDNFNYNNINENKLFHLINIIYMTKSNLLIITKNNIDKYRFEIKDLQSRINCCIKLKIAGFNKNYKNMFIAKLFSSKQLKISNQIINFIAKITVDEYKAIYDIIEFITLESRRSSHRITIPFIKKIL